MSHDGPNFYDDETIFTEYRRRRARPINPNDTIEAPILWEMLGDVRGLRVLDLGCGDARFGRALLARGAASYVGVEGSRRMAEAAARTLAGTSGRVERATMEAWTYPRAAFDLVTSRLALHYVADLDALVQRVAAALEPGGRFVFSVQHPVLTAAPGDQQARGRRTTWLVDDYFVPGPRVATWMGSEVIWHHRTIEAYFGALQAAGLVVEQLRESQPRRESFDDPADYERRLRIPLFLLLAARRP